MCTATKNGVTCNNAGANTHAGPHTGVKSQWGFSLPVMWYGNDYTPAILKRPLPGVKMRSDQSVITVNPSAPPPPAPKLTATGMDKNGTWPIPSTWGRPPGWIARSGFSDVEIEDDCLIMNAAGNIRITYYGSHSSSGFGYTVAKRVMKNGVELHNSTTIDGVHTVDTAVVDTDRIWMEVRRTGGFGGSSTLTGGYIFTTVL